MEELLADGDASQRRSELIITVKLIQVHRRSAGTQGVNQAALAGRGRNLSCGVWGVRTVETLRDIELKGEGPVEGFVFQLRRIWQGLR